MVIMKEGHYQREIISKRRSVIEEDFIIQPIQVWSRYDPCIFFLVDLTKRWFFQIVTVPIDISYRLGICNDCADFQKLSH